MAGGVSVGREEGDSFHQFELSEHKFELASRFERGDLDVEDIVFVCRVAVVCPIVFGDVVGGVRERG